MFRKPTVGGDSPVCCGPLRQLAIYFSPEEPVWTHLVCLDLGQLYFL